MKRLLEIFIEITIDVFHGFTYFLKSSLTVFASILNLIVPYVMYVMGWQIGRTNGEADLLNFGSEAFIPLVAFALTYYLRSFANKLGKGISVPIPDKRFTKVDDEGEVSVEYERIQELLLYTADLEDWLERKGML